MIHNQKVPQKRFKLAHSQGGFDVLELLKETESLSKEKIGLEIGLSKSCLWKMIGQSMAWLFNPFIVFLSFGARSLMFFSLYTSVNWHSWLENGRWMKMYFLLKMGIFQPATVDGSKIRRSPVEVGSFSQHLQGFSTIPGGFLAGFWTINSRDLYFMAYESIPPYISYKTG